MTNDCDEAIAALEDLIKNVGNNLTESDTRAKIIDPLFTKILGWNEKDITRELYAKPDYLDYLFSTGGVRRFVLEAKAIQKTFEIHSSFSGRRYKICGTISTNDRIRKAIEQTQEYCIKCGARYGIVSNGTQFIIFEAFKFSDDWRNGECVIFRSLEDIKKDFGLFWNILNKNSVIDGSLRKFISEDSVRLSYLFRPIDLIHGKNAAIARNDLSSYLQPIIDYVFADMIKEDQLDVLKKCYVFRRPYQKAGLEISRHFDRSPGFAAKYNVASIIESYFSAGSFEDMYRKSENFMRTDATQGSLILLMGGIGCGKTTFIHHFFNFIIREPSNTLWFYINFLDAPTDPDKIEGFILEHIVKEFEEKYSCGLKEELKRLGIDSISADLKNITILFSFLILKGYTISLVLDNVDQHSYVSPEYQEHAFLIARNLTDTLKTITILTLREESFFKSTMSGVLDSFPLPVFHIASPNFETLIRYRIDYVLKLIEKPNEEISRILRVDINIDEKREILKMFFEIVSNSFRHQRWMGEEILRFLEDISGGNMRLALYFFNIFLVSGNTDVHEMLTIENTARSNQDRYGYQIPIHHVIRSIILEHSRLYSSSRSRIMNVFNFDPETSNSHFLHLRILQYLCNRLSNEPAEGRGFVDIESILEEGNRIGIGRNAIASSFKALAKFGLIQFENQSKDGFERAVYVRLTNTGLYYLENLVKEFAYLDLVWMDTPITVKPIVDHLITKAIELKPFKTDEDIYDKFERTELFLLYLKKSEEREFVDKPEFKDSDLTCTEFMPEIIDAYNETKKRIEESRKYHQSLHPEDSV